MYRFKVQDMSHLDLDRVLAENAARGVHFTAIPIKTHTLVLASKEILSRFSHADNVYLAGYPLNAAWGSHKIKLAHRGADLVRGNATKALTETKLTAGGGHFTYTDIDELRKQAEAALNYRRSIDVKVFPLTAAERDNKFSGQEERYRKEIKEQYELADYLLKTLEERHETKE